MNSFYTGLAGLNAARSSLEIIGNNIANISTPGYARERANLESARSSTFGGRLIGGGVRVAEIERVTDDLLVDRLRVQNREMTQREAALDLMREVEAVFNEPGENGIAAQLAELFNRASSLSIAPNDLQVRGALVGAARTLADQLQNVRAGLGDIQQNVLGLARTAVDDVNRLTETVATLNRQIASARTADGTPPGLLDRRTQVLDELAQLIDIDVQELPGGSISITAGGQSLVSFTTVNQLEVGTGSDGLAHIAFKRSGHELEPRGGRLRGLLDFEREGTGDRIARLDTLAATMIRDMNRAHATGIPKNGGFSSLRGEYAVADLNGDGLLTDESLADAGLPFSLNAGNLVVSVLDTASTSVTRTSIAIDPNSETVGDLLTKLNGVSGITATLDASGKLVLNAQAGKRFHFANIVDPNPNVQQSLGSEHGQVVGTAGEPFALTNGTALRVAVDGGSPVDVVFSSSQFVDISAATADEVVAALNSALSNATAVNVDGHVLIRSGSIGTTSSIGLSDATGTPTALFGLSTTTDMGAAKAVEARAVGRYSGDVDETYTFRPLSDGAIGVTSGLKVAVSNSAGRIVATLDVGQGYAAGTPLEVAEGFSVSFGPGDISSTAGEFFSMRMTAASDSADALAAFGLNAFFTGSNASDIAVADHIANDPSKLSLALALQFDADNNVTLDGGNAGRLLALRDGASADLGERTFSEYYSSLVTDIGLETARSELALETQAILADSVKNRLEQVRGVSLDEELADLERFQQAYAAAARYITAVNDVSDILLNM